MGDRAVERRRHVRRPGCDADEDVAGRGHRQPGRRVPGGERVSARPECVHTRDRAGAPVADPDAVGAVGQPPRAVAGVHVAAHLRAVLLAEAIHPGVGVDHQPEKPCGGQHVRDPGVDVRRPRRASRARIDAFEVAVGLVDGVQRAVTEAQQADVARVVAPLQLSAGRIDARDRRPAVLRHPERTRAVRDGRARGVATLQPAPRQRDPAGRFVVRVDASHVRLVRRVHPDGAAADRPAGVVADGHRLLDLATRGVDLCERPAGVE